MTTPDGDYQYLNQGAEPDSSELHYAVMPIESAHTSLESEGKMQKQFRKSRKDQLVPRLELKDSLAQG